MLLGPAAGADSGWLRSHPTSASPIALDLVVASLICSWSSQSGTDHTEMRVMSSSAGGGPSSLLVGRPWGIQQPQRIENVLVHFLLFQVGLSMVQAALSHKDVHVA